MLESPLAKRAGAFLSSCEDFLEVTDHGFEMNQVSRLYVFLSHICRYKICDGLALNNLFFLPGRMRESKIEII